MQDVEVIKVELADFQRLQEIGIRTFREAFADQNSKEDMQLYLDKAFSTVQVRAELSHPYSSFYFAFKNNLIIGYLKVNFDPEASKIEHEPALELERIYVIEEFQGQKIGQVLFEKALAIAKEKHLNYIWLGVWEKNPGAIRFYKKHGFAEFDAHLFVLGTDEQRDILMKMEVK